MQAAIPLAQVKVAVKASDADVPVNGSPAQQIALPDQVLVKDLELQLLFSPHSYLDGAMVPDRVLVVPDDLGLEDHFALELAEDVGIALASEHVCIPQVVCSQHRHFQLHRGRFVQRRQRCHLHMQEALVCAQAQATLEAIEAGIRRQGCSAQRAVSELAVVLHMETQLCVILKHKHLLLLGPRRVLPMSHGFQAEGLVLRDLAHNVDAAVRARQARGLVHDDTNPRLRPWLHVGHFLALVAFYRRNLHQQSPVLLAEAQIRVQAAQALLPSH
mmetsp:Transcript_54613/g.127157  ORF Transcript_54613/g.127157 Transcript_54613/m.127157 type:complete len:273 (+) Transcript_54613:311-1129(+)